MWTTDRRLVRRALAGDKAAGELLVANHYPGVVLFLLHLSGHPNEAEDLAQEAFVKAWQHLHTFAGRASFRTWLRQIAYREYASRRFLTNSVELEEDVKDDRADFVARIVDALAIERAISNLPELLRVTFVICHIQEMSVRDASTILGIPQGTVLSRLASAREHLKRQLVMRDIATVASSRESVKPHAQEGPLTYEMSKTIL